MRRLVVCFDGTWNEQELNDDKTYDNTNVAKLKDAIEAAENPKVEQIVKYIEGVGTAGGPLTRLSGGALGTGINNDIKDGYRWLSDAYQDGDEVFVFGFSRGAFAARSFCGMIGKCGILPPQPVWPLAWFSERDGQVDDAFRAYRNRDLDAGDWRATNGTRHPIAVKFLGVWDTVGSLGIPDFLVSNLLDREERYSFHDTKLGDNVECARHALAIDERRENFMPTLWTGVEGRDVEQVWFAGVHSDVGGAEINSALGEITLDWMKTASAAKGLELGELVHVAASEVEQKKTTSKKEKKAESSKTELSFEVTDNLSEFWHRLPTRPRGVPDLSTDSSIHASVRQRLAENPNYWPTEFVKVGASVSVDVHANEKWSRTGLWLEAGGTYEFSATGEWHNRRVTCGPDGSEDGDFHLGEFLEAVVAPLRHLERLINGLEDGENAKLPLTPRVNAPWFKLFGVIAHSNVVDDGTISAAPHEILEIGAGGRFTIGKSGYLYGFANDRWQSYDNNSGAVQLSVTRL